MYLADWLFMLGGIFGGELAAWIRRRWQARHPRPALEEDD